MSETPKPRSTAARVSFTFWYSAILCGALYLAHTYLDMPYAIFLVVWIVSDGWRKGEMHKEPLP